jgi:hypothetical protein
MNVFARLPDATSATVVQPIPYRTESPITAGKTLSVLGITIVLLAVTLGVLLWARKRGWLQRWSMIAVGDKPGQSTPRVLSEARLGHASHVYVIDIDGSRFVFVESSRHVSLRALPGRSATPGEGHE